MTRTSKSKTRINDLLALVMVGGALAASPAQAQDSSPLDETEDAILVTGR